MPIRITPDQVRALSLAKQYLSERARGSDVVAIVRQIGPLRAKPAVTPYLALWTRMESMERQDLIWALYRERSLVRLSSADAHLYVVPTDDMAAYRQVSKSLGDSDVGGYLAYLVSLSAAQEGLEPLSLDEIIPRVLEVVSTRGACTVEELAEWLPVLDRQLSFGADENSATGRFRLGTRLIPALCAQGLLVPAEPRGSWKSERDTYATLGTWLPDVHIDDLDPREALARVLLDYISAYGPVTIGDMVHWLSGARRHQVVAALMALERSLARVEVLGTRGEAWVLRSDLDLLSSLPSAERFVRLLPAGDGTLMALRDASRFLPPEHRDRVYDWAGDSLGTVMVDGLIKGLWWPQSRGDRLIVRLFEPVDPEAMALTGEEARALGRFLEGQAVDIEIGMEGEDLNGEPLLPISLQEPFGV